MAEQSTKDSESVALRAASPEDEEFLYTVYLSTRHEEMMAWGWSEAQQEMFARMQFKARQQGYRMHFPKAEEMIILFKGERVGLVMFERADGKITMIDIALLPEFRNIGIGSAVFKSFFPEADAAGKIIQLHVRKENVGARRLYERLGFLPMGEDEVYSGMERRPARRT